MYYMYAANSIFDSTVSFGSVGVPYSITCPTLDAYISISKVQLSFERLAYPGRQFS